MYVCGESMEPRTNRYPRKIVTESRRGNLFRPTGMSNIGNKRKTFLKRNEGEMNQVIFESGG